MKFAADVDRWAERAIKEVREIRKQIVLSLFISVVMDTPVDKGTLRGNWQISSVGPAEGTIDIKDPSGNKTVANIKAFVESNIIDADQATYLTNNLPYAYKIEYGGYKGPTAKVTSEGFSRKATRGMVRKNVIEITENVGLI